MMRNLNFLKTFKNFKFFSSNLIHLPKFNFSTISLITREGTIDRSENPNFNQNINWELSKVWVTPHNNSYWNNVQPNNNFTNDSNEQCKVVPVGPMIQQLDFDRFLRKMGLTLSREENVYIQDGIYNGKKVRVISSDKEDAEDASKIFQEKGDFLSPEFNVLYLTDIAEVGTKRFVFYDKKNKVVIANTRNLENITKAIDESSA
jgi:hypothetical protein